MASWKFRGGRVEPQHAHREIRPTDRLRSESDGRALRGENGLGQPQYAWLPVSLAP